MIKENPEKRLEREIGILENSYLDAEIKTINKDEINVEINIDGQKINEILDLQITFLMVVGPGFPYRPPKLYCMTLFCLPSLADGRDLLEDVLNSSWNTSMRLIEIIQKIPIFLYTFINHLQEGERYEMEMLQKLPVFFNKITERVSMGNKIEDYDNRFLMISDLYVCVFEHDRWTLKSNNLTLLFWANIRSMCSIKKIVDENLVRFIFKNKNKKPNFELLFTIENTSDEFIHKILKIMSTLGIKYNVKKTLEKPEENFPIDVNAIEREISDLEQYQETNTNKETIDRLMELYKKIIEYYDETDSSRSGLYVTKLQDLIGCPKVKIILNEIASKSVIQRDNTNKVELKIKDESQKKEEGRTHLVLQEKTIIANSGLLSTHKTGLNTEGVDSKYTNNSPEFIRDERENRNNSNNKESSNLDGIIIDNTDQLNFDEGNESPDTD